MFNKIFTFLVAVVLNTTLGVGPLAAQSAHDIFRKPWVPVPSTELDKFWGAVDLEERIGVPKESMSVGQQELSWSPGAQLIRVHDDWKPFNLFFYFLRDKEGNYTQLNGTSPPIHALNRASPPLMTDQTIKDYVWFFGYFVRGEDGPFLPIETPLDTHFPKGITGGGYASGYETANDVPRPMQCNPAEGEYAYTCDLVMMYSNAMFEARIGISAGGMIAMLEDKPLATDLNLKISAPITLAAVGDSFQKPSRKDGGTAEDIKTLIGQLSTSDFYKCKTLASADISYSEIVEMANAAAFLGEDNWSNDDPADIVLRFFYQGPNVRARSFPYFRYCGSRLVVIAQSAIVDSLNDDWRLTKDAPAAFSYWITNIHMTDTILTLLETGNQASIRRAQALLRLGGIGGLRITGELDLATALAIAIRKENETFVPDTVFNSDGSFEPGAVRYKVETGQMVAPNGMTAAKLASFLKTPENREEYSRLMRDYNQRYDSRINRLLGKFGLDIGIVQNRQTVTSTDIDIPPNQNEMTDAVRDWYLRTRCTDRGPLGNALLTTGGGLNSVAAMLLDTVKPDRGLCLVGSRVLGFGWYLGVQPVWNLKCSGSDGAYTCSFRARHNCEGVGVGSIQRKDAECSLISNFVTQGTASVVKRGSTWRVESAEFR